MATLGSVFLGFECPDRGHRVQGGPAGRRTRSATPTLAPAATHLVLGPARRTGQSRRHPAAATSYRPLHQDWV